jgi:endonuclease YncB( thermonuclease family)
LSDRLNLGRPILGLGFAVALSGAALADPKPRCELRNPGDATVRMALDGRTLALNDGREVRLAGIEVADAARAALQRLIDGRDVALARLGPETDRYGRLVAVVAAKPQPLTIENSVQQALLAQGMARVSAHVGDIGCAAVLWLAERQAREAGLGLWADPHYVTRHAEDFAGILALRGRFAVVEGKVQSVRESGGTVYVNFGRRWSEDFTVTVSKRNERSFAAAGLPLNKLTGQRVRVRGTIEERGGPWIEASAPEQIEVVEHN